MKKTPFYRLVTILLAILLVMTLFACGSSDEEPTPAPEGQQNEPETDEVVPGSNPEADPEPVPQTEQPVPIDRNVPQDGVYSVVLYRDELVDSDGRAYVKTAEILYAQLDNKTVEALQVGDTVTLPNGYEFVIEMMQQTETDGEKTILFNEGLERCIYVPETDTWCFLWPSEQPYTYEGEQYIVPLAINAEITDDYTPVSMGENVYGMPYDETDEAIGMLDEIGDFFNYHYYLDKEFATITVANGEVVSVVFDYHE
ncbi:MAG: hypothetical protein IJJ86_07445 [Clostridia bacterium]|nr:hypothetical protein [Clostridia bacterium]